MGPHLNPLNKTTEIIRIDSSEEEEGDCLFCQVSPCICDVLEESEEDWEEGVNFSDHDIESMSEDAFNHALDSEEEEGFSIQFSDENDEEEEEEEDDGAGFKWMSEAHKKMHAENDAEIAKYDLYGSRGDDNDMI